MLKGLKRLDLWIPESHPIWKVPPRMRSAVAREWLDVGGKLAALEEAVARLERKLDREGDTARPVTPACINADAFFEI